MLEDLFVASGVEVAYGGKRRLNGERAGGVKKSAACESISG